MRRRFANTRLPGTWVLLGGALCAVALLGCGDDDTGTNADAGDDAGALVDAGVDAGEGEDAGPDAGLDAWIPPACPTFGGASQIGTVESTVLTEISGIAESRNSPGVLWAHNDSGDAARIYARTLDGDHLADYLLLGTGAQDWEDLAVDDTYVYVGDFGDNNIVRSYVTVYRIVEPVVSVDQAPVSENLSGGEALEMQYPDGPHNAETLLVDPLNGDIYIVTKEDAGDSLVFLAAAPHTPGSRVTLEQVGQLPFGGTTLPGSELTTGGDVTPSGDGVIVKTYSSAYFWWRPPDQPLWAAFETEACVALVANEPQGEAVGFATDGSGYYTVSEGTDQPIYFFSMTLP